MRILFLALAALSFSAALPAENDKWLDFKSTHFVIYYKNAPESLIRQLSGKAEDYYASIASDLGFIRYDFWTWENRAKIYVYDDAATYQADTGQPAWSAGAAFSQEKKICTFSEAKGFLDAVLPHEMGHIIFREFVGFDNYSVPLWLDEGVASYQQKLKYSMADAVVKEAIKTGGFIGLESLSGMNPQSMYGEGVGLFYMEAVSLIDYLIKRFGRENFVLFCQNLRDKKDLTSALAYVYSLKDLLDLELSWKKHLKNE